MDIVANILLAYHLLYTGLRKSLVNLVAYTGKDNLAAFGL
jgi:hypothetical protein